MTNLGGAFHLTTSVGQRLLQQPKGRFAGGKQNDFGRTPGNFTKD